MADAEAPDAAAAPAAEAAPAPAPAPAPEAEPEVPEDPSEVVRHLTGLSKDLEEPARVCLLRMMVLFGSRISVESLMDGWDRLGHVHLGVHPHTLTYYTSCTHSHPVRRRRQTLVAAGVATVADLAALDSRDLGEYGLGRDVASKLGRAVRCVYNLSYAYMYIGMCFIYHHSA